MFATISVRTPAASAAVKVPQEAVLHSGERSLVIVQKRQGLFEPREVTLGPVGGGWQEIRSGVQAGELVVTSSQFLIDSESNLKAAISQMMSQPSSGEPEGQPPPITHQH
jgi:Cu(I)/Ag(I) efflux system membrane fusion protein